MLTRETPPVVFQVDPFAPVDGFVRTQDAIRLECWTGSDQNAWTASAGICTDRG
jgi:hypothetical protein